MSKTNQVAVLKSLTFKVYKFLAWNPLDSNPKLSAKIYFWAAMAYTATCLVQEIIYFVLNFGAEDSFLNLTNLAPCMGFTTLACIKILTVYGNRMQVTNIYKKLESFCSAPNNQIETVKMVKPSLKLTNALTRCYLTLIWMFNLAPLFVIVYYFLADGSYHRQMPYVMWYPWDCNQPFYYEFSYAVVTWGAFTSAIGILSTDLMLCNIVTLCCIRFNKLRIEIKRIVNGNLETSQLRKWIDDHTELLDIVDDIEGVFSLSILLNFLGSSLILCLVGFQTLVITFLRFLIKRCFELLMYLAWRQRFGLVQVLFVSNFLISSNIRNLLAWRAADWVSF